MCHRIGLYASDVLGFSFCQRSIILLAAFIVTTATHFSKWLCALFPLTITTVRYMFIVSTAVLCGDPPPTSSLNVTGSFIVASTGVSFLDTVFYRCPQDGVGASASVTGEQRYTGRICQASGTWSDPYPPCAVETPGGILLTPEHPQLVPPAFPAHQRRYRVRTKWICTINNLSAKDNGGKRMSIVIYVEYKW